MSEPKKSGTAAGEKKPRKLLWALAALAILAAVLLLLFPWNKKAAALNGTADPAATQNGTPADAASSEHDDPAARLLTLHTPVGELGFPDEYAESVELSERAAEGSYSAVLEGRVGESRIKLFELLVGAETPDYLLGYAPDADGNRLPVGLNISEIPADPAWSEEEVRRINLTQSCVNDLIEQINGLPGFEPAH